MGAVSIATALLDILSLVQAGFELKAIVDQVKAMEDTGASQDQVHAFLKGLRVGALGDLKAALA